MKIFYYFFTGVVFLLKSPFYITKYFSIGLFTIITIIPRYLFIGLKYLFEKKPKEKDILENNSYSVITLYYGINISEEYIEYITDLILKLDLDVEVASVETKESVYCLTITFE